MTTVQQLMQHIPDGMDAALITSPVNRRYYTGFPSSAGTVLVTREKSRLIIDSRYYGAASKAAKVDEVILQDKLYEQLAAILQEEKITAIGVEDETTTLSALALLQKNLPSVQWIADSQLSDLISKQRRVKTQREIDCVREAQRLADETFAYICEYIEPGMTEREIALEMEFYSKREGSEANSFDFIVAGGPNSAVPHAVPGDYRLRSGDFLVMDFGCTIGGYGSDMTRTVAIGKPSQKQVEVYHLVLEAQQAALDAIKAGVVCEDIDRIARDLIDATAYKGLFGHGLGHALGLQIHEAPRFAPSCKDILPVGCLMSVEPGIYLPDEFGVRIEDIVVATEEGFQNLTESPKELIIL